MLGISAQTTLVLVALFFGVFFVGSIFGSFFYACALRIRKEMSISRGRSECHFCHKKLQPLDLVPIFSFLILQGHCRHCKKKISSEYLWAEASMGLVFTFIFFFRLFEGLTPDLFGILVIRDWILFGGLFIIFIYDLKYREIPDMVALPLLAFALIFNILLSYNIESFLLGALVGAGFFALQYLVSRGKWIGAGDIRLGAILGAILGHPLIWLGLLISYVLGALVSVPLLLQKKKKLKSEMPFGTFLAVGGFLAFYLGDIILSWYLKLL